jgi:predicted DCC family thiol-disulfide oxidoreductase YuxK
VYFDGACPLCLMEIGFLRRADRKGRLVFEDVSPPDAQPSCPLPRERLMARFHVRLPDGRMVSGARAFTEAWSALPGLGFLRLIGAFAPTRIALDALYGVFLRVRPAMQRWARRRSG